MAGGVEVSGCSEAVGEGGGVEGLAVGGVSGTVVVGFVGLLVATEGGGGAGSGSGVDGGAAGSTGGSETVGWGAGDLWGEATKNRMPANKTSPPTPPAIKSRVEEPFAAAFVASG